MNICSKSGWMIGNRPLPDDPIDHDAGLLPKLGCTNLRCSLCNAAVRSVAHHTSSEWMPDLPALHALADPAPALESSSLFRFYFCRCNAHSESGQKSLDDRDDPLSAQWACAGHPIAQLPHSFDGLVVSAETLGTTIDRALAGNVPGEDRPLEARWLARLAVRLASTPHQATIVETVASRVADANLEVRARALHFFTYLPAFAKTIRG